MQDDDHVIWTDGMAECAELCTLREFSQKKTQI